MKKKILNLLVLFILVLFSACQGFYEEKQTGLTVVLSGKNSSRAAGDDDEIFFFNITCEKDDKTVSYNEEGKTGDEIIFEELTPGNYTVYGEAFSDEEKTVLEYRGNVGAVVISGTNTPVKLVLKKIEYKGGDVEGVSEISLKRGDVTFGQDCFSEILLTVTYDNGTTEDLTLEQLINAGYDVTFAEQGITADMILDTGIRNNAKKKFAGKVPIIVEKGSYKFEGQANVTFDQITLGYSTSGGSGSDILDTSLSLEELSSLELIPMHCAFLTYDEINGQNVYEYYDFFSAFNDNITVYKDDGTCEPSVNIGDSITVTWEVQFNDDPTTKTSSADNTINFAETFSSTSIEYPIQISCTVSSEYFEEDLIIKYQINNDASVELWY